MKKQSPTIEWHILDECIDGRFASTFAHVEPEIPPTTPRRRRFYAYIASAALLSLLTSGWLWHRSQSNLDRLTAEVQEVTEAEVWAAAHSDPQLAANLTADPSARKWHEQFEREDSVFAALQAAVHDTTSTMDDNVSVDVDIDIVDLFDDQAVVQVTLDTGISDDSYRQVRFYKSTAEGWLHTAPDVTWWGVQRQFESTYFVFEFRKRDAGVVAEAAPQVDAMYAKMRRDFGLAATPPGGKAIIEISPTELPGVALPRSNPAGRFVVPSPALYLAPATVSDAELVLQSIALQLSAAVIEETVVQYQIFWVHDENILSALQLWALWDLDLPLAEWHEEVVAWRLGAMQAGKPGSVTALPSHYEELCAIHNVWLAAPSLLSIPLTCTELDRAPLLSPSPVGLSATRLEELTARIFREDSILPGGILWPSPSWATVMLATLFDYTVSSYGREQLPIFLAGLGHYRDWPAFSLAVFDTPSSELAADWYAYLVAHYAHVENVE
ncbi:MAG: hypothetical protein IT328_06090 [Caldilineaceae bacterium]|nr:hypothetical protein [Caldilineaceae bacterium]